MVSGNLKLARGSTTLMSNQYAIAISSSNPHKQKWYVLMALDFAPQNPTYTVKATAAATGISGEAKILAISGLTGASAQGSSTAIGQLTETTLATLSTSLPAGDNVVIAILESQNTDTSIRSLPSLNLKRGSNYLATAQFYVFYTASSTAVGAWQVQLIPYLDASAPASAQYTVTAKSDVTIENDVYGRATIVAFSVGSLSAAYSDGPSNEIKASQTIVNKLSCTSFLAGSDVMVIASEQLWNYDTSNYNYINADLNKLQQDNSSSGQATNQYTISLGISSPADDNGKGFGLLNRFTSTPASPQYEVWAQKSSSYTVSGEAKILALSKPPKVPEFPLSPLLPLLAGFAILMILKRRYLT